jgi:acetylornithine/succinyldiaminopimelate/putrescine aminotransferase/predicted amino acid dehydrogenase
LRSATETYGRYCRPKLADLLKSLRLDRTFERASGSYVFHREERATGTEEVAVLDLVSGFGACLLGHNNPELKQCLIRQLDQDVPMLAQSSVRAGAGHLAERLNQLIPARGEYRCNFSNSGAEAVEAAMKHAYKARFDEIRRDYEQICRQINDLCAKIEQEELQVELPGTKKELSKFRDDLEERNLAQFEAFRQAPVVIALKGSFHGKTSSALAVTFNKSYREGYEGLSAVQPVFVDPEQVERLPEIAEEQQIELLVPRIDGARVVLDRVKLTKAIAFIFEVIIGEGGIRALPEATLETLARLHAEMELPYIIDEVQTGCGRTGAIFAYSQTPLACIEPEYITLSKALGGGLVKIGATLIHEEVYDPDFGILHTSTFAEDDLSCAVACEVLEILSRDNSSLLTQVERKGAYLVERLRQLQVKYPQVVREVRGRGLMIGLEFQQLQDRSPLFRYAGKQGFLSLLVASYLLHHHQIRVLAPLTTLLKGNPGKRRQSVMRVQPSAYITTSEIERVVSALDEVLNIIDKNNEYLLVAHLVGQDPTQEDRQAPAQLPVARPLPRRREDFDARIGFVLHPTSMDLMLEFYFPSFSNYGAWDRALVERWWTGLSRFLEPDVAHVEYIESGGFIVETNIVVVPFLPKQMIKAFNRAKKESADRTALLRLKEIQDKVQDAVTVARELGDDHVPTSMVGLGAFTSVVTRQGTTINDYEVPVTTGNAYTAALMIQSIERAAGIQGLDLKSATCAVVGAAGNIGAVLASTLAPRVGQLKLIGRDEHDSIERLGQVRAACGADADVSLHTDCEAVADCDVVAIATNSTIGRLITPDSVKRGAIVCNASVPSNLCHSFKDQLEDYLVFDGGLARLPEGNIIDWVGLPGGGLAFGCMSEALLLGFDGHTSSFAKGPLKASQVEQVLEMSEDHGFSLGEFKLAERVHPVAGRRVSGEEEQR